MIPTRIYYSSPEAKKYVGVGKSLLHKLKHLLGYNNIPSGRDSITLKDGVNIVVTVNHGLTKIEINAGQLKPKPKKLKNPKCDCGRYFAEGVIKSFTDIPGYEKPARIYTVDICQKGNTQLTVNTCVARDYSMLAVGERVWCSLDIRETAPLTVSDGYYSMSIIGNVNRYLWCMPWGSLGTEKAFTIKKQNQIELYPCNKPLNIVDWPPIPYSMCSIDEITENCYWLENNYSPYTYKSSSTIASEKQMLELVGAKLNPEKTYNISHKINIHVMPMDKKIDANIFDYEIRLGIVTDIDYDANTVDVQLVDRIKYEADTSKYVKYDSDIVVGDILTNVEVLMTTDVYYYATEAEKLNLKRNEKACSIFFDNADSYGKCTKYVNVMVWIGEGTKPPFVISRINTNYNPLDYALTGAEKSKILTNRIFPTYSLIPYIKSQWYEGTVGALEKHEIPIYDLDVLKEVSSLDLFGGRNTRNIENEQGPIFSKSKTQEIKYQQDTWDCTATGVFTNCVGVLRPQNTMVFAPNYNKTDMSAHSSLALNVSSFSVSFADGQTFEYISSGYLYYNTRSGANIAQYSGSLFDTFKTWSSMPEVTAVLGRKSIVTVGDFYLISGGGYWFEDATGTDTLSLLVMSKTPDKTHSRDTLLENRLKDLLSTPRLYYGDTGYTVSLGMIPRQYGIMNELFNEKKLNGFL